MNPHVPAPGQAPNLVATVPMNEPPAILPVIYGSTDPLPPGVNYPGDNGPTIPMAPDPPPPAPPPYYGPIRREQAQQAPHARPGQRPPQAQPQPYPQASPSTRAWYAALALYLLAPMVAEMLSGSTPPLMFINPVSLLFQTAIYGSGALIAREIVRRGHLGWGSIVTIGAAFGVLNEGLVVTSWTNPYWPDILSLHGYSRAWGVNWFWAEGLTIFHAVVSVTIPIILVEAIFPALADRPWLGRAGFRWVVAWLTITSFAGFILFGFVIYHKEGYAAPLPQIGVIFAIGAGLVTLATQAPRLLGRAARPPTLSHRAPPKLGSVRVWSLLGTLVFFALNWEGASIIHHPPLLMALMAGFVALAAFTVWRWGRRPGWGARHRLAFATGVMLFFILLAPVVEFIIHPVGRVTTGLTIAALGWLIGLIVLSGYARRTERKRLGVAIP